ncbi:lipoyl synthase [Ferrovum sp.]|uniref:lipoyl synthase n=1 Tax=Ferrovum sp. TaxID=2609467 RepID=UPI00263788EF|nr:lipoyl synthase [Ferrovum sp.]
MSIKEKGALKTARIPIKVQPRALQPKPAWIRVKIPTGAKFQAVRTLLREENLHTVCEEAACPNIGECFSGGTATFMILGDRCTRRCPFCDVGHGRPDPVDPQEPRRLARSIQRLGLRFVVVTSVDRDDLRDGGAGHFVACIQAIREASPATQVEILVPDFRGRLDTALELLGQAPPQVFNHNLETVPRLYPSVRPGADYGHSLHLLRAFKALHPTVATKSGLMLGLGETLDEVREVLRDLRAHGVEMLTLGQYLQPSVHHLPVTHYWAPEIFEQLGEDARRLGFGQVASGPLVRSSYHAESQAKGTSLTL